MEILKNNNWCKINEAFQLFVNTGRIMPAALRPEVERSWNRCRNIDPWTPRPNPVSQAECNQLVKKNAELMEFTRPVLQYMYATNTPNFEDNIAQLTEKTGVILDICTRVCTLPNPLNKKVSEESIGTSITGIALAENIPIELGGTELLKACYQTCYGGAAPVNDSDGKMLGVISLYNNYGKIPEQPLEFVITAAKLIEDLLKNKHQAHSRPITDNKYFTEMINYIDSCIVVVDKEGKIQNCNDRFVHLMNVPRDQLLGKKCGTYGIELENLISDLVFQNKDYFSVQVQNQSYSCLLQNNKTIKWGKHYENTLLLFRVADLPKARLITSPAKENSVEAIINKGLLQTELMETILRAAKFPSNVLLEGESGTGKELFARAIHNASRRANKPFIAINCGAIPKEILQSEFFGYEDGAFTGGKKGGKVGQFEAAHEGTILLDEIGEMPLEMQVSLLRFLQDKKIVRVGGHSSKNLDVRIIAATNRNLKKLVADGLFREDLFYRLNVIPIVIPPLRDRKEEILPIANYYLNYYSDLYELPKMTLLEETQNLLYQFNWPGNIRQLMNVIENAMVFCNSNEISPDLLPVEILTYKPGLLEDNLGISAHKERELILRALNMSKGNVSLAAKSMGISRNTMYRKIDKYGLHCTKE